MKEKMEPGKLISIFLGFFGIMVLFAIPFSPTTKGQITNLICGGLIVISALIFFVFSKKESS